MKTAYKYPFDFGNEEPYKTMTDKHILTPLIEKINYKENTWLQKEKTEYFLKGSLAVPQFFKTQHKDQANPETMITYVDYTWSGKPYKVIKNGILYYYVWSFGGQ